VKEHFSNSFIQSVKELSHKLHELAGISMGLTQVRYFIKKAGFKWLQSGHVCNGIFWPTQERICGQTDKNCFG
jgi:hypothetical protein